MARSGGGNCTRSPVPHSSALNVVTEVVTEPRPEMGREDAALHELVANWHSLTASVKATIMDLARMISGRGLEARRIQPTT